MRGRQALQYIDIRITQELGYFGRAFPFRPWDPGGNASWGRMIGGRSGRQPALCDLVSRTHGGVVVVALSLQHTLERVLLERTGAQLESRARGLADQCESELVAAQRDLTFLAGIPAFQQLSHLDRVDPAIRGVPEDVEIEKRQLLAAQMRNAGGFSVLYVLQPNGDLYLVHPFRVQKAIDRASLAERPYYREAVRTNAPVISDSFAGADGSLATAMLVPIHDAAGEVVGYLGGAFHLTRLSQLVSAARVRPFDAGFILDRQGQLAAHTDLGLLKEGARERFAATSPGAGLHADEHAPKAKAGDHLNLRDWLDPADGKHYMTSLIHLNVDWHLGLLRDRAALLAEARPVVRGIALLTAMLLLGISVIGVAVAQRMGRSWAASERALRESETRFRSTFEQAAVGIAHVAPDGRWLRVNQKLGDIVGYTREELLTTSFQDITHPDDLDADSGFVQQMLAGDIETYSLEKRYLRKDGTQVWINLTVALVRDAGGEPAYFISVVEDIAARKQAEEERLAFEAQVRQSQKIESIGTLAGGVAHEINNPIMGIMNYAQLIKDELGDKDETLTEFAGEIIHETKRIATLVRNLLQFARHEKRSHSPARIYDIVEDTLSLIRTVMRHDQITLEVNVPEDLPRVKCRSQQIQQVAVNLLTNARDALNQKYAGYHENKLVRVTACRFEENGEPWVRVTVEDRGPGIAPVVRDRMFDPFYTTKDRTQGTGLGLSISHGIITDHCGKLSVEAELGEYTRFDVDLPVDNGWEL